MFNDYENWMLLWRIIGAIRHTEFIPIVATMSKPEMNQNLEQKYGSSVLIFINFMYATLTSPLFWMMDIFDSAALMNQDSWLQRN